MDYFTILAQCALLNKAGFAGAHLDAIRLHGTHDLYLGFDNGTALKLGCTPGMPYIHVIEKRYLPVRNARDWHFKTIRGAKLTSLTVTPGDRVLTFHFSTGHRLVFELTGRYANIILADPDNIISGVLRIITSKTSGFRELKPGVPYTPPPPRVYSDPRWGATPVLTKLLTAEEGTLAETMPRTICNGSKLMAEAICESAGIVTSRSASGLTGEELDRLFIGLAELVREIEDGGRGGTVVTGGNGLPRDVFPLPLTGDESLFRNFDTLNEAVEFYARGRERGLELNNLNREIETALNREEQRLSRTLEKIEGDITRSNDSERLEHTGTTILANLHMTHRGMESVTLTDPYDGSEIDIVLDPTLDGPANAERYFERSRKLKASVTHAMERRNMIRHRIDDLRAEREQIEDTTDIRQLRSYAQKYRRIQSSRGETDNDQPFPRRFTSISGLEIIVGRTDSENDELIRWARKNDVWLHAQNIHGSHVILRSPGRQNPDNRSIQQAASIAAYYSKSRTSAIVPVAWTLLKYVVKRRGQGPGQVTYTREKVLFVEPGLP